MATIAEHLQSSQAFVRALKAPSDPPSAGGPSKLAIASAAWSKPDFRTLNKDEVIVEWLLGKFAKERGKPLEVNPLLDLPHWALLSDILFLTRSYQKDDHTARPLKVWLTSLLHRTPFAQTLAAYLSLSSQRSTDAKSKLDPIACKCLQLLWSIATSRMAVDTVLDIVGALLDSLSSSIASPKTDHSALIKLASGIIAAYQNGLSAASTKKKLRASFLADHLQRWIELAAVPSLGEFQEVISHIFSAGSETLFHAEALRNLRDEKPDTSLFEALGKLLSTSSDSVLAILPRLLLSFIQASRKHRATIATQAHAEASSDASEHARKASMDFFLSCYSCVAQAGNDKNVWRARAALLEIVDLERLFSFQDRDGEAVLTGTSDLAYKCLEPSGANDNSVRHLALEALATLARIDYDLVAYILPKLSRLMFCTDRALDEPVHTLLSLLLEYHAKTRSIPDYIRKFLSAQTSTNIAVPEDTTYCALFSGPVLSAVHLGRLAKAVSSFTTPGQVAGLCSEVLSALETSIINFQAAQSDVEAAPRKKRKTGKETSTTIQISANAHAVVVAVVSRLAAAVLSNLPFHTIQGSPRKDLLDGLSGFQSSVLQVATKQAFKILGKSSSSAANWHWRVVAAALLRFEYDLVTSACIPSHGGASQKLNDKIIQTLETDKLSPELAVVSVHWLLSFADADNPLSPTLIDVALKRLVRQDDTASRWSGLLCDLAPNNEHDAVETIALLHLLLTRWLPVLELYASEHQLCQLAENLTSVNLSLASDVAGLSYTSTVSRALHSANFWELPNLRDAILAVVTKRSSSLSSLALGSKKDDRTVTEDTLRVFVSTCEFLLRAPSEYIPRQLQLDLCRKCLVADTILSSRENNQPEQANCALTVLRAYILQTNLAEALNPTEIVTSFIQLVSPAGVVLATAGALPVVTGQLLCKLFQALLQLGVHGREGVDDAVQHLLATITSGVLGSSDEQLAEGLNLLLNLIDVAATGFEHRRTSSLVVNALADLHEQLHQRLQPIMDNLVNSPPTLALKDAPLRGWCRVLTLGRWLHKNSTASNYGSHLISRLATPLMRQENVESAMHLLIEEIHSAEYDRRVECLERILASYLVWHQRFSGHSPSSSVNATLSKAWKSLSVNEYTHALQLVIEAASSAVLGSSDIPNLIRLAARLLHDTPEGTLKTSQQHIASWLSLTSNRRDLVFIQNSRLQFLDMLVQHLSDRPASLRPIDMPPLLSTLSVILGPTTSHDASTSTATFHSIASILSALVRLRRDLLTPTLPHFAHLLHRLISSLRQPRPQLGAKQARMVTDTLPQWVGQGSIQLGAPEARVLARLLTGLTTKTVVRTYTTRDSSDAPAPAASLARAFSKHSAPVLRAYVDALADPLSILTLDVRRELEPGLFSLCEMTSEHARDALVASSLDASGKVLLKALWKEYEKQRYVGKG